VCAFVYLFLNTYCTNDKDGELWQQADPQTRPSECRKNSSRPIQCTEYAAYNLVISPRRASALL